MSRSLRPFVPSPESTSPALTMNRNKRCPCNVVVDPSSGVLHCVGKCRQHVHALLREMYDEEEHYRKLGATNPDVSNYHREFTECFGAIPYASANPKALEIGPGTSPYLPLLDEAGYSYSAVEPSLYASQWLADKGRDVVRGDFEKWEPEGPYSLVLAAHSLEHMGDAPKAVTKIASVLQSGGVAYLIVPNDEDLCNPDHYWFFTPDTLRQTVQRAGLRVESLDMKQRIKREQFIYCKAVKP